MTIEQLQAYVDSKPDIRGLINVIVDYIQSNPGGGGGVNIYTADGALSGSRNVDLNNWNLDFSNIGSNLLHIDPLNYSTNLQSNDGTAQSLIKTNANTTDGTIFFDLQSTDGGDNEAHIKGDGLTSEISYTAATHIFNTGASGSFTTNDGKTVTVVSGLITSIV